MKTDSDAGRDAVEADGKVLVSVHPDADGKVVELETDSITASVLSFLEAQMVVHPEQIAPADAAQLRRISALVAQNQ